MEENLDLGGAFEKIQEMLGAFNSGEGEQADPNGNDGNFDLDPLMLIKIMQVISEAQNPQENEKTRLLMSLKPFLKKDRQKKVDSAVKLMGMSKIISLFKKD